MAPAVDAFAHGSVHLPAGALFKFFGVEMPRIKRWFRMSHDINRDSEMWEFREIVGRRADAIWEEILSIADRNEGYLPGKLDAYPTLLAYACHSTPSHIGLAIGWLTVPRGNPPAPWITIESDSGGVQYARVTKWLKYNGTWEDDKIPPGKRSDPLLSYPSEPSSKKKTLEPVDNSKEELKVIFDSAATLADGNLDKLTDVKNWIGKTIREAQGGVDRAKPELTRKIILRSIQALKKLGTGNLDRDGVFAYLTGAFKKIRTEEIQGESAKYKQGGIESAGEILQRMKTESK